KMQKLLQLSKCSVWNKIKWCNTTLCTFEDSALRLPLAVIYSLFFLFGLAGNLYALWVFLFLHSKRNSVWVFLINCAVADLVLLACLPFRIFYHVNGNKWVLGSVACKMVGNLFYMNMYISITLLVLISLDRYLRLKGRSRERRGMTVTFRGHKWPWSKVACGALWGLSLLALTPMIATAEDKDYSDKCFQFKSRRGKAKGKAYFNAVLVIFFWLVFIMLVVSYVKIALQLLRTSRNQPHFPNAQKYERTAKKTFFVLLLFTVCFAPYHAFRPVYILSQLSGNVTCEYLQQLDRINEVMLLFSAFNSCLDPVMYFLVSGSARKAAVQALGNGIANRLDFLNNATSYSSTTEFRRASVPMAYQTPTPSLPEQVSVSLTPPLTA
uniref:Probable G-protein coupled receptor 34 n=1 Tax=Mola mola TaxID=94237 RepID=A0A3Q3WAM9_MOLML